MIKLHQNQDHSFVYQTLKPVPMIRPHPNYDHYFVY